MTLKTIDAYTSIAMASGAELPRSIDRNGASVAINRYMTLYALLETVTLGPHPLMHGLIALMKQENHVVASDDRRWFHALLPLSLWDHRQRNPTGVSPDGPRQR
jgi:hypothetical protein